MTLSEFVNRYFIRALLIPIAFVGFASAVIVSGWQVHTTRKHHQMIAEFLHHSISEYLSNAHHLLRTLAWQQEDSDDAGPYELKNISGFYRVRLIRTGRVKKTERSCCELLKAGVPVVYFPDPEMWPSVSVPYYNPEFKAMTVGVIVRADKWVAFGEINLSSIYKVVKTRVLSNPETSVIITDKYGNVIFHPDFKLVRERENLAGEPVFKKVLESYGATSTVGMYRGQYVLATGSYVGPWEWVVTILHPLRGFLFPAAIVSGTVIFMILVIGTIVIKFRKRLQAVIISPIESIAELARAVERGERLPGAVPEAIRFDIKEVKELGETFIRTYKKLEERDKVTREMSRELFWLVESIGDAVIVVDRAGRVIRMNGMAETVSGWNRFQALGRPIGKIFKLFDPESEIDMAGLLSGVILEERVLRFQEPIRLVSPDGSSRYVMGSIYPLRDGDGNVAGTVVVLQDVTAQVEAEKEKRRLERILAQSQKMESLGTLASGIAHEFNNLLQILSGYVELALDVTEPSDRRYDWLTKVKGASERAREMVTHLLTFSREQKPRLQVLDANRLILDTLGFLRTSIPRMISIETFLAEGPLRIKADPRQLELVLINLVVNARDAIKEGESGVIRIRSSRERDAGGKEWVRIDVEDTGCGIPEELLDRIFEPFFTTKGPGKGTGLGLSAVYGIVQSHGGRIGVKSTVGKGSVFSVYLPATEDIPVEKDVELPPEISGSEADSVCTVKEAEKKPVVLVVDDEPLLLDFVSEMLRRENFEILTATSGEAALECVDRMGDSIDVVILDINMPGMGGLKCLEEIRSRLPEIMVIIASGYISATVERRAKEYGNVDFIKKPYEIKELLGLLKKVYKQ